MDTATKIVNDYYHHIEACKKTLFALYEGEKLERKIVARGGGWTWGYRLMVGDQMATGSSIGEDEIKFFLDLPHIVDARYSFCIGVAFGLSTFTLALAKPDHLVFGIDNYTERAGDATDHARELVQRVIRERVTNVHLHIGTSPQNTAACLARMPKEKKLSIVFIDALHRNPAATADFQGVKPFLNEDSVILWHNVNSVHQAFTESFPPELFDRRFVLHTYGIMGIYYNSTRHAHLEAYIKNNCLIWHDWETFIIKPKNGV